MRLFVWTTVFILIFLALSWIFFVLSLQQKLKKSRLFEFENFGL